MIDRHLSIVFEPNLMCTHITDELLKGTVLRIIINLVNYKF